jgi:hypothetical protein
LQSQFLRLVFPRWNSVRRRLFKRKNRL